MPSLLCLPWAQACNYTPTTISTLTNTTFWHETLESVGFLWRSTHTTPALGNAYEWVTIHAGGSVGSTFSSLHTCHYWIPRTRVFTSRPRERIPHDFGLQRHHATKSHIIPHCVRLYATRAHITGCDSFTNIRTTCRAATWIRPLPPSLSSADYHTGFEEIWGLAAFFHHSSLDDDDGDASFSPWKHRPATTPLSLETIARKRFGVGVGTCLFWLRAGVGVVRRKHNTSAFCTGPT